MREIIVNKIEDAQKAARDMIQKKQNDEFYFINKDAFILTNNNSTYNHDYANEHQYVAADNYLEFGGTLVTGIGDISVLGIQRNYYGHGRDMLQRFVNYLASRDIQAYISNNDVLVDGKYKVMSFVSVNKGDAILPIIYTGYHFSINPNLEAIQHICTKPMINIPKGLKEYGITTDDIIYFLKNSNKY